jgi:putative transposase
VSKTPTGKVFASVLVETVDVIPAKVSLVKSTAVGIDVGLKDFATLSTGEVIANPRFLKKSLKKLNRLSRQHSKKVKGSANRNKSRIRLARQHEKINNQRTDFLHKISTRIIRENQTVCVENLNISGMMKNHKLARAIADVSWGSFVSMLEYKCDWQGKNLVRIGRYEPSSKLCTCGTINHSLILKDRVWTCGSCGTTHDRDLLAANNIVRFAFVKQNLLGLDRPEITLDETDSGWSLTQESPRL